MHLKLCILLTAFLTIPGCTPEAPATDKDVYQGLFNYLSKSASEEHIVVISEKAVTAIDIFPTPSPEVLKDIGTELVNKITPTTQLQNTLPATSINLQKKFIERLTDGGNINELDIPTTVKIKPLFVRDAEIDTIFSKGLGDGWKRFRAKYVGAQSLVRLSRPAIDLETDTAIVYAGASCGGTCGQGNLYLLAKLKGKWLVVHVQNMWVS